MTGGNDCFALPPGVEWMPVDAALTLLRERMRVSAPVEMRALAAAEGCVLARPVTARRGHPPAANCAVDGYAFAHAGPGARRVRLALCEGRSAAGAPFAGAVPAGHAVRVLTGALLPEGTDTVVMEEDVAAEGGAVSFDVALKAGANVRPAEEDTAAGAVILDPGTRLMPQHVALAASTGRAEVPVYRPLRVGVLSTGDELVAAEAGPVAPHRTFDANRPMLLALLRRWGMDAVDLGHAGDSAHAVRGALEAGAARTDAILTSGGASASEEDHLARVLEVDGTRHAWRIAIKPGRPLALGTWDGVPVFGLPGNPVAAFVCALVFARPALRVMAGAPWEVPEGEVRPAAFAKRKKAGRQELLRARLNGDGRVEVFASEGSGRVSGLVWADGLAWLGEAGGEIAPGDPVRYVSFSAFGL